MTEGVMVFAPAPQLTVTIEQLGEAEAPELHVHPGGQGVWQARLIAEFGVPVTLCAVLGGETGRIAGALITEEGIRLRAVTGKTASGWYVHDRRGGERRTVAEHPGAPLGRHDLDELYGIALAEGLKSEVSVLSGPADPSMVPDDAYRRLTSDLVGNGARVAADLSGDQLAAVVAGGPAFVKVSDEELPEDDPAEGLRRLRDQGAGTVVVTRAERPALALVEEELLEVRMPRLEVADHRGAGDSLTAAVVAMLARGADIRTALRTGAAAGALNVTRHGLGTGRVDAIAELAKRVELVPTDSRRTPTGSRGAPDGSRGVAP